MELTKARDRRGRRARVCLPTHLICSTCDVHIVKGSTFIAVKEDLTAGERYIGAVKVFRYYFGCRRCSSEIAFRTHPDNSDITVDAGARRVIE